MSSPSLIDRLRSGHRINALWQQSASELMTEMAARVGFDTLVIDNEHGPASIGETLRMVRAAHGAGAQTIVRAGSHARDVLSRTLDTGTDGLLVPMVNSAAEARAVVDICRYAPLGNRGVAANVVRASGYGTDPGYLGRANAQTLLAIQIESAAAIDNLDAILAVPGIDMLFIGPGDLSASMGFIGQLAAPAVVARIEEARQKILAAGKLLGSVPRPDVDARGLFALGCALVVDGSDIGLFRGALQKKLTESRATAAA
jgi:4-hydroxy-2-oxoheptanedioate aldolase